MTRPLDRVLVADQALDHARIALDEAVAAARAAGSSWHAIGKVLGTTRQAAFKRFGGHEEQPAQEPARSVAELADLTDTVWRELADGRAAAVNERMNSHAAKVLHVADLESAWVSVEATNGTFSGCEDTQVRTIDHQPVSDDEVAGPLVTATTLLFERGRWHGRIAWDSWDRIAGILIVPAESDDLPF